VSTSRDSGQTAPRINFSEEMRGASMTARQGLVLLTLSLLVLLDGMDTQMLGVIAHDLTRHLDLPISEFGIVFSTGLLGGVLGALVMSPLADRWLGRKNIAILSMTIASIATIATPWVRDLTELLVVRFIAGVGLGAALPSIMTLAAEFSPQRYARPITSGLVAFMPLGSFLGSMIGKLVIPDFGWQALLYVGGSLTLIFAVLAMFIIPESVHFLITVKKDQPKAAKEAKRVLPNLPSGILVVDQVDSKSSRKTPIVGIFADGFWKFTLLLWVGVIFNQGILYFVLSWTPALLQNSGLASSSGMDAAAMFGLGGALGTALQGWLATRFNLIRLMFVEIGLYLVAILTLPMLLGDSVLAPVAVFFMAAGICAYQAGFVLLMIETYPNDVRTTGFGWGLGIGRVGATSSPVIAGALVTAGWSSGQIFTAASLPGIATALALLGIALLRRVPRDQVPVALASAKPQLG
jgi:AAHS family 4-hydroxybenzoate transporter-like MFS transporter